MHRCLFSSALPAEIRCLSARFLTQRQPLRPRWLPAQPQWRSYNTGLEENKPDESSWIESPLASRYLDEESTPNGQQHTPYPQVEGQEDPYDFILEGYAAEPIVRQIRRKRVKEQLASVRRMPSRMPVLSGPSRAVREKLVRGFDDSRRKVRTRARLQARSTSRRRIDTWERLPQVWGRPKYVTLQTQEGTSEKFSHAWNMNFARVHNQTDSSQRSSRIGKVAPLLDTRTARWVEIVNERQDLGQPLDLENLAEECQLKKSSIWSNIALWLLYYDRASVLDFLHSTSGDPQIPATRVADSLHLCLMHLAGISSAERAKRVDRAIEVLHNFAERISSDNVILAGSSIRHLLKICNSEQLAIVYQAIRTANFRVHHNTYLHFASILAKNDHFHQGLDALLQARHSGAITRSPQFRSVCATLLRRSVALPGGMRVCLRIVDNLVKIGVALTTRLCNVLILNAVEAGDLKTAYAIYHSLVEHKLKADKYTYALLLKGCKQTLDSSETLNETIQSAIAGTKIMHNPILATEILHCLALHHSHKASQDQPQGANQDREVFRRAWYTICEAYIQLFDLTAVEQLGLPIPVKIKRDNPPASTPMPATAPSVAMMLQIYCQLSSHGMRASTRIHEIYQQYKFLTKAGEAPFNDLARTDYCANAFLTAFTKSKSTLTHAAAVIKDMQRSIEDNPILGCAPTVRSWSIFLHGFTRHGEMRLAEQVLMFMRSKGIEPNEVTWNTLLAGYAGAQDAEGLLDASRRSEQSGHVWDEFTYRGLRRLRDVKRYRELVEGKARNPKLDFTDDLKAGLGARIADVEHEEVVDGEKVWEENADEAEPQSDSKPEDVNALESASEQHGTDRVEAQSEKQSNDMDTLESASTQQDPQTKMQAQIDLEPNAMDAQDAASEQLVGTLKRRRTRKDRRRAEELSDWESDSPDALESTPAQHNTRSMEDQDKSISTLEAASAEQQGQPMAETEPDVLTALDSASSHRSRQQTSRALRRRQWEDADDALEPTSQSQSSGMDALEAEATSRKPQGRRKGRRGGNEQGDW